MKFPNMALPASLLLFCLILVHFNLDLSAQYAAPGYILDSTMRSTTYVVQVGTDNGGRPIYEKILAPYQGIKHRYNTKGLPEVETYHRYDFGESETWYLESAKYHSYNPQSLPIEVVRYAEDSTGTQFYELETFQYDVAGNMRQRNWYGPTLGTLSIDTAVQNWAIINIYQYTYDDSGNVLTKLDSMNRSSDEFREYTYNSASMVSSEVRKAKYGGEEWGPNWGKTEYIYENKTRLKEVITSTYLNNQWTYGGKEEYQYYPFDSIQYEIRYMWGDSAWMRMDTIEHVTVFNDLGQISTIQARFEIWEYTYHPNGKIDSIIYQNIASNHKDNLKKYDEVGNLILHQWSSLSNPSGSIEYHYRQKFPLLIEENEAATLHIYPNPTAGELHFSGDFKQWEGGSTDLLIYNIQGQLVQSEYRHDLDNPVNVFGLSPGIYLIVAKYKAETVSGRFIKE